MGYVDDVCEAATAFFDSFGNDFHLNLNFVLE